MRDVRLGGMFAALFSLANKGSFLCDDDFTSMVTPIALGFLTQSEFATQSLPH